MIKKHNFSAGPSILPQEVFEKSSQAILDFQGIGLSVLEISHRSKEFLSVMEEVKSRVKHLMKINDDYEVLLLGGGASMQFMMVPFNLMKEENGRASYLDTGTWAMNAIKEAQKLGKVDILASSRNDNYSFVPKDYEISKDCDYFHCTSNNTIYGTQMKVFPKTDVPMVCDMSSDIFSRVIDYSQFDLIYAGAQKNLGAAGVTLVVVRKEILGNSGRSLPSYLDYQKHIERASMYNTPPVFAVYIMLLTLQWLEDNGGVEEIEKRNIEKAKLIYDEIDRNPLFEGLANKEDRSLMNVSFNLTDETKKAAFDDAWKNANISGLNGHRSVGGYRASIYNAMPIESVQVLVDVMKRF